MQISFSQNLVYTTIEANPGISSKGIMEVLDIAANKVSPRITELKRENLISGTSEEGFFITSKEKPEVSSRRVEKSNNPLSHFSDEELWEELERRTKGD